MKPSSIPKKKQLLGSFRQLANAVTNGTLANPGIVNAKFQAIITGPHAVRAGHQQVNCVLGDQDHDGA